MQDHLELEPLWRRKLGTVLRLVVRGRALLRQRHERVELQLTLGGLAPHVDPVDLDLAAVPLDDLYNVIGRVGLLGAGRAIACKVVEHFGRVLASCKRVSNLTGLST